MLFKKNDSANLVSKSTKKKSSPENERSTNYFTVSNIFTDNLNLKLGKIEQIAKTIPTVGKNLAVIFF